ncbi:serine-threonine/tyrosine-protein kinase catalytic domain-containing protein [Tanacetum coccineum]
MHETMSQRIVHYDIKPANILLDLNFSAKVADFGLAKLCNRDNSHITMTRNLLQPRASCTMSSDAVPRSNIDVTVSESQEWFPIWAWNKYERNKLNEFMIDCGIEEKHEEVITRMLMVALCCVQYKPEKSLKSISHLFSAVTEPDDSLARIALNGGGSEWSSSEALTTSTGVTGTSLMARYEITVATD